jgi:hypothetical protein
VTRYADTFSYLLLENATELGRLKGEPGVMVTRYADTFSYLLLENATELGRLKGEPGVMVTRYADTFSYLLLENATELGRLKGEPGVMVTRYADTFAYEGLTAPPFIPTQPDIIVNDVGVNASITPGSSEDLVAYLPPEYEGMDISDAVVFNVDVIDNTTDPADDAYTDITINVGEMDVATCNVFKAGMAFLPEVDDVTALPTVDGEPAFSRDLGNNTVTIRLYVGDPLLGVVPAAEPLIFDTGEGTHPSISGTFTGTIAPSRNLTVSSLYTYYCEGTGGHTKSIDLYENQTLLASGVWGGYQGDWHNVTLTSTVMLLRDHEYRYVITTGSYPQIIHAESKDVMGGSITCEEFVDVNGKTHTDWIPAIKLWEGL